MKISEILIHYIAICISTGILALIFKKYSSNKVKFDIRVILKIMIISIAYFVNNLFIFNIIKIFTATILAFILNKWIYKDKIKKTIYYTIALTFILYITDLFCSLFLPLAIKNVQTLNNNLLFKVTFSLIVNIIFYFISTNKYVVNFLKQFEDTTKNKLYYLIGGLGVFISNLWLFLSASQTSNKYVNLILCITEILIFIFIIITLKNKYEKNIAEIKKEQLEQNLKLYSKIALEYKELKHNLMNDFLIIKSKTPKKEQPFMNDIINKYKSNYEWVNDVTDIPEGLQGLVFLKKNQAEMKKIKFNLEYNINKQIESTYNINNNFRLYETLGIVFDNAIEGAYESKEKLINVVFSYNNKKLKISIYNTFSNDIDLDKIGNKNYSTKNRGSGIGLNYIRRQKNKFVVNHSIQNNIFITDIIIDS